MYVRRSILLLGGLLVVGCGGDSEPGVVPTLDTTVEDAGPDTADTADAGIEGCLIDGEVFAPDAVDPADPCRVCDPETPDAWTSLADGTPCGEQRCFAGACSEGCVIDGALVGAGAASPDNACLGCDPLTATDAWTPRADGTACGEERVCTQSACEQGCYIDGAFVTAGAPEPGNPCRRCDPALATGDWTVVLGESPCGAGQVCEAGACAEGCQIDGVFLPSGDQPELCRSCEPTTATDSLTDLPTGTACGDAQFCDAGACLGGCWIGDVLYAAGDPQPDVACQRCEPATDALDWTADADGLACGAGVVCQGGTCAAGCGISGEVAQPGDLHPVNLCLHCSPDESLDDWSPKADGTPCGAGSFCVGSACTAGCWIEGTLVAEGALNPANPCERCETTSDDDGWTALATGSGCGDGKVCEGNACISGCYVGGSIRAPQSPNPDNGCQQCAPATATEAWSNLTDGVPCAGDGVCLAGVCSAKCFIAGTPHDAGTLEPGNPCRSCQPAEDTQTWSALSDGAACGDAKLCHAATCKPGCLIDGTYYAPDAVRAGKPCQRCVPAVSNTAWTSTTDGASCGAGGNICTAGECKVGCYVDGGFVASGATKPGTTCQTCQPTVSTAAWSNVTNGVSCGSGTICHAGQCKAGCLVSGSYYAEGTPQAGQPCRLCTPAASTSNFTNAPDGTVCATGTCVSLSCVASPVVASVSPQCGPNTGGTVLTITGGGFAPGVGVTIGAAAGTNVTLQSSSSIKATTPAAPGVVGGVDVVVSNTGGQPKVAADAFRYFNPAAFGTSAFDGAGDKPVWFASAGDLDGDGDADLVTTSEAGLHVMRGGAANGSFAHVSTIAGCGTPGHHAVGEVTGDVLGDLVIICGSELRVYSGVAGAAPTAGPVTPLPSGAGKLLLAHVNGDGDLDVLYAPHSGTSVQVFLGDGDGTFTAGPIRALTDPVQALAVGDVTGDGKLDLVTGHYDAKKLRVSPGDGTGTFGTPVVTTVPGIQQLSVAKLTGDAYGDVVVASDDPAISAAIYPGSANGSLGTRIQLTGGGLAGAVWGDFNADGFNDVAVSSGPGIRVYLGEGSSQFGCVVTVTLTKSAYQLFVADFDGDGLGDLFGGNPNHNGVLRVINASP